MQNYTVDPCGPVYVTIGDGGNIEGLVSCTHLPLDVLWHLSCVAGCSHLCTGLLAQYADAGQCAAERPALTNAIPDALDAALPGCISTPQLCLDSKNASSLACWSRAASQALRRCAVRAVQDLCGPGHQHLPHTRNHPQLPARRLLPRGAPVLRAVCLVSLCFATLCSYLSLACLCSTPGTIPSYQPGGYCPEVRLC